MEDGRLGEVFTGKWQESDSIEDSIPQVATEAPSVPEKGNGPAKSSGHRSRLFGLLRRRESWCLSVRGWLVLLGAMASVIVVVLFGIHPFLAVSNPTQADVLVVEGWIPDYALSQTLAQFQAGNYKRLLTAGGLYKGGIRFDKDDTYAHIAEKQLIRFGAKRELIEAVPAAVARRDRTYASAVAIGNWLAKAGLQVKSVNVVTLGAHARRTRLLYQKALGERIAVGVISVEDREYDPKHWWRYSEGVKEVMSEGASYLYARLLFRASEP